MFYTYEATLTNENEGGYTVAVPSFECMVAGGGTVKEACENAAGCLQLVIADMLDNGERLPEATFGEAPQLVLCVEVSDSFIKESACMTLTEAAEELGVTPSRIAQLLDAGLLTAAHPTGKRMVTIESVNERKKLPRRKGRPRKKQALPGYRYAEDGTLEVDPEVAPRIKAAIEYMAEAEGTCEKVARNAKRIANGEDPQRDDG